MDQEVNGAAACRAAPAAGPAAVGGAALQALAHRVFERWLDRLPRTLALQWPGGGVGPKDAALRVTLQRRRLLLALWRGRVGELADAHVRGRLDIEGSMRDLMAVVAALVEDPVRRGRRGPWARGIGALRSAWQHQPVRDASHVRAHYDLCDDFFALWLDPHRVYSCAYYAAPELTLERAQQAKLDLVCRKLQLGPGQRFLDVGAGWGALLLWAAQHYDVQAVGITLSRHQFAHVSRLIEGAGLGGRVSIKLLDYRELPGEAQFDRIASVGMFEHVGRAQLARYFATLHRLLRPGGLMLSHGIAAGGLDHGDLGAGMGRFIDRHIFPGGEVVHVAQAVRALAGVGLELLDVENLRPHYARTLWAWSDRLEAQLAEAHELTSAATVRAYRLYLAGSALCFERGWIGLYQLLATRNDTARDGADGRHDDWPTLSDYPFTRSYLQR